MLEDTGKRVSVAAYNSAYDPVSNIPIATAATTFDDPDTGISYLLVFHQAIWFGNKLDDTLLCPNQIRANGHRVDDTPQQFSESSLHSIECTTEAGRKVTIPLTLNGVISRFETRRPTRAEIEDGCERIILTNEATWEPYSHRFTEAEESLARHRQVTGVSTENECDHQLLSADIEEDSRRVEENLNRYINMMSSTETTIEEVETMKIVKGEEGEVTGFPEGENGETLYGRMLSAVRQIDDSFEDDAAIFEPDRFASAMTSTQRKHVITPAVLSRRWHIGLKSAEATLKSTTQEGMVSITMPGESRVTRRLNFLRYPRRRLKMFMDTMFAKIKSLRQCVCAQIYTDGYGYDCFYPMRSHSGENVAHTLDRVVRTTGIMDTLFSDGSKEQTEGECAKRALYYHINQLKTDPYTARQNRAEKTVGEVKKGIKFHTRRTGSPKRVWCYCGEWLVAIRRLTAREDLDGRTAHENVLGTTPDISLYLFFDWYQVVWYHDPVAEFPYQKKVLGRWIGVSSEEYRETGTFYILTSKGTVVARKSVWGLSDEDKINPTVVDSVRQLDLDIAVKLGDSVTDEDIDPDIAEGFAEPPLDLFDGPDLVETDEPEDIEQTAAEADERTPEELDEYLTAEVIMPRGGELVKGTVRMRKTDENSLPIGKRNSNPILDTRIYEVEFPDGSSESYSANVIAENIYSQTDAEGRTMALMDEIVDHRSDGRAVKKDDGYLTDKRGRKQMRHTTVGWQLLVKWRDHSTSWITLADAKESNPVEVAEYAVANKLVEEPAFAWWVKKVLRKRDRIIKKVKTKYWLKTHKFGIELPKTVKEALEIDRRTNTTFWRDAIAKEMQNVNVAFDILDSKKDIPVGYKEIKCHIIFDIKMDLTRKARLVAGGHMTEPPKESVYSSVVSRDSVRIAFTLAALNDLEIMSADIQNAYLNAPTSEKVWTTCGMEFGQDAGKPALIVRALYGLRSAGKSFRSHARGVLESAGFKGCLADPDVYMRKAVKKDGSKYWEYVLMYVDDILIVSENPTPVLKHFEETYTLKKGSVKEPDSYLGADIRKYNLEGDGDYSKVRWAMSSDTYVKRAIAEVERELAEVDQRLQTRVETPLSSGYRPELDSTPELDARRLNYYQGLIGVLRWICELGRVDILYSVSIMSSYLASPRKGHLDQVFHIFAYLKKYNRSSMVFNDIVPDFDDAMFNDSDWAESYPDAREPIPPNAPEARGKSITMTAFVDADHAGCRVTRRSHTGFFVFINKAPILFFSKRQNTVESSTFGSEFVALRLVTDAIEGLRYKLRMMGVSIDGATNVFCDNESVVRNSTAPESTLKKKHNAICYHRVREAQAAGIIRVAHHVGRKNLADIATKSLPGPTLRSLVARILY